MLPYVHRITKYDPADRDEHGHYVGVEDTASDRGSVEAAYLEAIAVFAQEAGVGRLEIRDPFVAGLSFFGAKPPPAEDDLARLFSDGLLGFHDGARVSVAVGLELVRVMLRDKGAWCRLAVEDQFFVHVGYDQYVYVGSDLPCERAQARTQELGLFAERLVASPYEPGPEPEPPPLADEGFWDEVSASIPHQGALLLEEQPVGGFFRWHRLTHRDLDQVRAGLGPHAQLRVWPGLSTDLDTVHRALQEEGLAQLVWQEQTGEISGFIGDEEDHAQLAALLTHARAAAVLPLDTDEHPPLFTAVTPLERFQGCGANR
ncbi:RNA-binding protein [Spirillospora sp. NPDC050679]